MKTKIGLISLSISLGLSELAGATGTGMQIVYSGFTGDTSCVNDPYSGAADTTLNVNFLPLLPGHTLYASDLNLPDSGGNQEFSLIADYSPHVQGSAGDNFIANFYCPTNSAGSKQNPQFNSNNTPGDIKVDYPDFNSNSAVLTISGQCENITVTDPARSNNTAKINAPVFTCTPTGFTGGTPASNQITTSPIPDVSINADSAYPEGINPVIDLSTYFTDLNPLFDYRNMLNRPYYSITVGGGKDSSGKTLSSQSITQSTPLFNLGLFSSDQSETDSLAYYRSQITNNQSNQETPSITSPVYQTYCSQVTGATNYYDCLVTVCACDPGIKANADGTIPPGTCPNNPPTNYVDPDSQNGVVAHFQCNVGQVTPTTGGGPVVSTFHMYVVGPQFLPMSIQDIAKTDATANNDGNALTRFVIPINPSTDPKSEIPLDQYFKNSNNSSLINQTYLIVGIAPTGETSSYTGNSSTPLPNGITSAAIPAPGSGEPVLNSANATSDWSPIKVNYLSDPATPITPDNDGLALSIDGHNLVVDSSNFKPTGDPAGGLYQITIQGTETAASQGAPAGVAYQTIYLNVSNLNTSQYNENGESLNDHSGHVIYTPMKPFNSAWMYLPGFENSTTGHQSNSTPSGTTPSPTIGASTNNNICDLADIKTPQPNMLPDPCVTYSNTLNSVAANGTPIQALTPDVLWIAFQGSSTSYPASSIPIDNNFFTDKKQHIPQVLSFFRSANPGTLIFLTAELDNPVRGGIDNLSDTQVPPGSSGTYTQMDQLVWATAIPFTIPCTYTNNGQTESCTPDGLQFDVEPFSASAKSVEYYKRVADILARHGKPLGIFAFPNATIPSPQGQSNLNLPSTALAIGPLGIILPSTYDVGGSTDPDYISSAYLPNFMKGSDGQTYLDNNCHWSAAFAGNYSSTDPSQFGNTLPIESYCNMDVVNTLYGNSVLLGENSKAANPPFAQIMNTYGSHFQLAIPSAGSAINYTAQIIYNPVCNAVDETPLGTVPMSALPINTNPYGSGALKDVCPNPNPQEGNLVNVIPALPSNFTENDQVPNVIADIINQTSATSVSLNALMPLLRSNLKPLTYYVGEDTACEQNAAGLTLPNLPGTKTPETTAQVCRYIIYLSNPNNEGSKSYTANHYVPDGGSTPSQDVYVQAFLDFAQGNNTEFAAQNSSGTQLLGSPAINPNNLGLAMYALSSEEVIGCLPGESHAFKQNCLLALPITTPIYDPTGGTVPPVGRPTITIQSATITQTPNPPTNLFYTYEIKWTLNCPSGGSLPSHLATISTVAGTNNGSPFNESIIGGATPPSGQPAACGETFTSTFTTRGTNYTIATGDNVSIFLIDNQYQRTSTPSVTMLTTSTPNSPAFNISSLNSNNLNSVWEDAYEYTRPFSQYSLAIQSATITQIPNPPTNLFYTYEIKWTLNCPIGGSLPSHLATISTVNGMNGNTPFDESIIGGATPINPPAACGGTFTSTFTTRGTAYSIAAGEDVSLFLIDNQYQQTTPLVSTSLANGI